MDKKIVVKIGGEVADSKETAMTLLEDLITLKAKGYKIVLCHGGGPQITKELNACGVEAKFVNGLRVTDAETLKITAKILLGEINPSLVAMCNSNGTHAVGLSGLDNGLYQASQMNPELGFVGKIDNINTSSILDALNKGLIPIVASIGAGADGQKYNINADSAAGELAAKLEVDMFLVFTNVDGLYRDFKDKSSLIKETSIADLQQLAISGALTEGMIPKIESILLALSGKTSNAVIVDGRKEHAVLNTVNGLEQNKPIYGTVIRK